MSAQLDALAGNAKQGQGAQTYACDAVSSAACLPIDTLLRGTIPDDSLSEEGLQGHDHFTASCHQAWILCDRVARYRRRAVRGSRPRPEPVAAPRRWLQRGQLERCLGQVMTARTKPRSIGLQLMRVDDVPNARDTGAVGDPNSFIVLFRGPRSPKLTQGTYRIKSPTLGTFSLFLVPGWTYESGTAYTATFNRI